MERLIGLDVHAASTTCAVIDARGKRVRVDVVETNTTRGRAGSLSRRVDIAVLGARVITPSEGATTVYASRARISSCRWNSTRSTATGSKPSGLATCSTISASSSS
jgi:hypothetical protein